MDNQKIKKLLAEWSAIQRVDFESYEDYRTEKNAAKIAVLEAAGVSDLDQVYLLVYSDNQRQFITDAEYCGLHIDHSYSGRGMYGRTCPAVRVENLCDLSTSSKWVWDSMGKGYVMYAQY